jgi:hypothetical protein
MSPGNDENNHHKFPVFLCRIRRQGHRERETIWSPRERPAIQSVDVFRGEIGRQFAGSILDETPGINQTSISVQSTIVLELPCDLLPLTISFREPFAYLSRSLFLIYVTLATNYSVSSFSL